MNCLNIHYLYLQHNFELHQTLKPLQDSSNMNVGDSRVFSNLDASW